nr:MAG TPA: hypothetical protein [Caudoviricetes sp.]
MKKRPTTPLVGLLSYKVKLFTFRQNDSNECTKGYHQR